MRYSTTIAYIKKQRASDMKPLLDNLSAQVKDYENKFVDLKELFSTRLANYNSSSRDEIKNIVDGLMSEFKDYRAHMLNKSKKKDLPETILYICNREFEQAKEAYASIDELNKEYEKYLESSKKRKQGESLAEKIYPLKDEYIRNSGESISKAIREWDCLIQLIEDGDVTESELIDYGIDIADLK